MRDFHSAVPALLQLLPEAFGLDHYILRISTLLPPLVAKPAKIGPVALFALRESLDLFGIDFGAVSSAGGLRVIPRDTLMPVSV